MWEGENSKYGKFGSHPHLFGGGASKTRQFERNSPSGSTSYGTHTSHHQNTSATPNTIQARFPLCTSFEAFGEKMKRFLLLASLCSLIVLVYSFQSFPSPAIYHQRPGDSPWLLSSSPSATIPDEMASQTTEMPSLASAQISGRIRSCMG
jgi:hypothetical protein